MVSAVSSPNIALIKYWGNRNELLRLPAADSLSITLDSPLVTIEVRESDKFSVHSFDKNGRENMLSLKSIARFMLHSKLVEEFLGGLHLNLPENLSIVIRSQVPEGIGLASSAAIFSALAEAYASFLERPLTREEVSVIARLGSGSAARSVYGGFVALRNTSDSETTAVATAVAEQIAPENHWTLHDIILIPSEEQKKVGSTEGHAGARASPLFSERLTQIPRRMSECIDAIQKKDFEKLQRVSEEDALEMHAVMESQNPPLHYLSAETHRILKEVKSLREKEKLEVLYTMDAGPTVHLLCTDTARTTVEAFAQSQGCRIFKATIGSGARIQTSR